MKNRKSGWKCKKCVGKSSKKNKDKPDEYYISSPGPVSEPQPYALSDSAECDPERNSSRESVGSDVSDRTDADPPPLPPKSTQAEETGDSVPSTTAAEVLGDDEASTSAVPPPLPPKPGRNGKQKEKEKVKVEGKAKSKTNVSVKSAKCGKEQTMPEVIIVGADATSLDPALCSICYSSSKEALLLPCNHLTSCMECAQQLKTVTKCCPICRKPIKRVAKVFIS